MECDRVECDGVGGLGLKRRPGLGNGLPSGSAPTDGPELLEQTPDCACAVSGLWRGSDQIWPMFLAHLVHLIVLSNLKRAVSRSPSASRDSLGIFASFNLPSGYD